jgi:hypothetical protein
LPGPSIVPFSLPTESPGRPESSCLQAVPAMEPRVASILASFSGSVSEAPGCPVSSLLQLRLRLSLRVAPSPQSSGLPTVESPGRPESSTFRPGLQLSFRVSPATELLACLGIGLRVAPDSFALGHAVWWIFGLPRISYPPAAPSPHPRVAPIAASTAVPLHVFGLPRILLQRLGRC